MKKFNVFLKSFIVISIGIVIVIGVIIKMGVIHCGLFPVIRFTTNDTSCCEVDLSGFLGCYIILTSHETNDFSVARGQVEVFNGNDRIRSIVIGKHFDNDSELADQLNVTYATYGGRFIPSRYFPDAGSIITICARKERDSPPFDVWVGYLVSGTKIAFWRRFRFIDSKAAINRVRLLSNIPTNAFITTEGGRPN